MTTTTKGLSASQVARRYEISRQTAHYFMQKVREAMKSSESHKMNDRVQVDEFTIGGCQSSRRTYIAPKFLPCSQPASCKYWFTCVFMIFQIF